MNELLTVLLSGGGGVIVGVAVILLVVWKIGLFDPKEKKTGITTVDCVKPEDCRERMETHAQAIERHTADIAQLYELDRTQAKDFGETTNKILDGQAKMMADIAYMRGKMEANNG